MSLVKHLILQRKKSVYGKFWFVTLIAPVPDREKAEELCGLLYNKYSSYWVESIEGNQFVSHGLIYGIGLQILKGVENSWPSKGQAWKKWIRVAYCEQWGVKDPHFEKVLSKAVAYIAQHQIKGKGAKFHYSQKLRETLVDG